MGLPLLFCYQAGMAEMEGVSPFGRAWCVGKNRENCFTYYLLIYTHSKWASFVAFYQVAIVQEHVFSWLMKTIIHFGRCGPTDVGVMSHHLILVEYGFPLPYL